MTGKVFDMGRGMEEAKKDCNKYIILEAGVQVHIVSKTGVEHYPLSDDFTGVMSLEFNQGGVCKVERREKLR